MKNKKFLAGEEAGTYIVPEQVTEADILDMALKLARVRLSKGRKIEQPSSAFSYLQTLMHEYEHEVFGVLFLDTKHRVIRFEELFKGKREAIKVDRRLTAAFGAAPARKAPGDLVGKLGERRSAGGIHATDCLKRVDRARQVGQVGLDLLSRSRKGRVLVPRLRTWRSRVLDATAHVQRPRAPRPQRR